MSAAPLPRLSIVTVNLNNATGLKKTIESVAGQSFHDREFIVIDGGSTDGSREVISAHADAITRWVSEPDAGIYEAMNKGLRAACGEYIHFLNSGDRIFSPETLELIFAQDAYGEDLLYGNTVRPDKSGVLYECRHPDSLTVATFWGFGVCQQAFLYKRELFDILGEFDESFRIAGDWEFNLRALLARRSTRHLPFPVVHYQGGGISVTREDLSAREKEIVLRRHLPDAVYWDYLRLQFLEAECGRLKKFEDWVEQIRDRSLLINVAMVTCWFWLRIKRRWSRLTGNKT